jgi:ABC-type transport system involved in multi-copper enzyme maturation permease subunit
MAVAGMQGALNRSSLSTALIITRRELRDSLRDWRILIPILILTLIFPFLMDITATAARNFALRYGGANAIIAERLNPFLLMIVGFFPISFSLVIALETFVGEKERNSLEPLLSVPVSDGELYLGKMLAALLLPLSASYLGITVYLIGLYWTLGWLPGFALLSQIVLLTSIEALVMVSGAVVVSSQTTSVRAANLLASFIIIPMALLIQVESVLMFWGQYNVIWWIIVGLLIVDLILVRMGVRIFNREEILSKEMDDLNFKTIWRDFRGYFLRPPALATKRNHVAPLRFDVLRIYIHDIPTLIKAQWLPVFVVLITLAGGSILGGRYAASHPLPQGSIQLDTLPTDTFENLPSVGFLPRFSTTGIFFNNLRALTLAAVLAIFSFGVLALILLMIPLALVGFFTVEVSLLGYNPWMFVFAFLLPHGVIEMPAAIIGTAFALRVGAALVSPPQGLDVGQGLLLVLADFCKIFFFLVVPLLLLAAFIEANVTPQIVLALYAGR